MNRKEFLQKSFQSSLGCCTFWALKQDTPASASPCPAEDSQAQFEKEFVQNWLSDLLGTMDTVLDRETQVKLMEGCGRGCFRRFKLKQDIAQQGKGDLQKLMEAYKKNFEIWQENNLVHIRYGEVSNRCYCPAAHYRPAKPHDVHCECTRATHQTIFETALGHPIKVDIAETLRRGGKTCHFLVHVS